jgi:hypothetical protein
LLRYLELHRFSPGFPVDFSSALLWSECPVRKQAKQTVTRPNMILMIVIGSDIATEPAIQLDPEGTEVTPRTQQPVSVCDDSVDKQSFLREILEKKIKKENAILWKTISNGVFLGQALHLRQS